MGESSVLLFCWTNSFYFLKIRLVITNAPPLVGGLEKVCLRLAQRLHMQEHDVEILARFTQGRHSLSGYFTESEPAGTLSCEGVRVRVLPLDAWSRLLLKPIFKLIWRESTFPLARWLYVRAIGVKVAKASEGSDIVHFFGNGAEMLGFAAESAARHVSAKFVVEPALHEGQWGDNWMDALLYKKANLLLAHSLHESVVLERMGIPVTKIRKVVHGVDVCDSGDGECFRKKYAVSGPMVLFLGRKTLEKGVGRLLEAWPLVAAKFPQATLVVAGPQSAEFEKLKSACFNKSESRNRQSSTPLLRILNLDDLTDREKQDALAACDLLCVPSAGESFGMVYFEAWAYKKPVVALDLPVLRETIGAAHAGILVGNDLRKVGVGIIKLLENPELRKEMGENGYRLAGEHSWQAASQSYLASYGINYQT